MDKVIHFEIPADDVERAQKFYGDVFGWKITEHGGKIIKDKMAVGDMGFAAYFKDSEGNILGLWENKMK